MKFKNAKVVGEGVDSDAYHLTDKERGDIDLPVSSSMLTTFASCPSKWRAGYTFEGNEWGSLIDMLLLSPELFPEKYAVKPETYVNEKGEEKKWSGNAKICKEWVTAQAGKETISIKLFDEAKLAVKRLMRDEKIAEVIETSRKQVMIVGEYHDQATGLIIPCKALIDLVPPAHQHQLADLKTTRSAARSSWGKTIYNLKYHMQAAMYIDMYNSACPGDERDEFLHIVSENIYPYETGRRTMIDAEPGSFMGMGRFDYEQALALYCKCLVTNTWPGYDDNEHNDNINGWTIMQPEAWMV